MGSKSLMRGIKDDMVSCRMLVRRDSEVPVVLQGRNCRKRSGSSGVSS